MSTSQKRFIRRSIIRDLLAAGLISAYAINTRVRVTELSKYGGFLNLYRKERI